MESLLKKKKSGKGREPDGEPHTDNLSAPQEIPADPPPPKAPAERPSLHEPSPRERPRIKTREAVSAREGGDIGPSESGRATPSPGKRMRRTRIKTRKSAVHDDPSSDVPPAPQAGSEPPQVRTRDTAVRDIPPDIESTPRVRSEPPKVKTRDAVTGVPSGDSTPLAPYRRSKPPDCLSIKTKDACIQGQPTSPPEQPPQTLVQGNQEFMRERGRTAAMKRAETQRVGRNGVPQARLWRFFWRSRWFCVWPPVEAARTPSPAHGRPTWAMTALSHGRSMGKANAPWRIPT